MSQWFPCACGNPDAEELTIEAVPSDVRTVRASAMDDPEDEEGPRPTMTTEAGEGELRWMNFLIKAMWPNLRKAIVEKGKQEMIDRALIEFSKHQQFTVTELSIEFDPGKNAPVVSSLYVYKKSHHIDGQEDSLDGLQVDFGISWTAAQDFKLAPRLKGKLNTFGNKEISLDGLTVAGLGVAGTASVILAPLIDHIPVVGSVQCFFLDQPTVKLKLNGWEQYPALKVLRPMIKSVISKMVTRVLAENFVLPARMLYKVRKDLPLETLLAVKSPVPAGLLEVEVVEAEGLMASDVALVGKATSDPFVTIQVGDAEYRSSTVSRSVNPKWSDGPDYMPVYNMNQLVKINIYDDDVLTEDDHIGLVDHVTVYKLCQACEDSQEGFAWFEVLVPSADGTNTSGGRLKLRARFLKTDRIDRDGEDFVRSSRRCKENGMPQLLTLKLLGLEGERTQHMNEARVRVNYIPNGGPPPPPPKPPADDNSPTESKGVVDGTRTGISHILSWRSNAVAPKASKKVVQTSIIAGLSGLGFGKRSTAMSNELQSTKATHWGIQQSTAKGAALPATVARAIEQLKWREDWPLDKIAALFGLDPSVVETAAKMRANFEVAWHQGLHFLVPPDMDAFDGIFELEVYLPGKRMGKAVLVKQEGKLVNVTDGATDSKGKLGQVRLFLSKEPVKPDHIHKRRVRARLRRLVDGDAVVLLDEHEKLRGDSQCDETIGQVVPGMLIEFMVEVRNVDPSLVKDCLEDGQHVVEASTRKQTLVNLVDVLTTPLTPKSRYSRAEALVELSAMNPHA